MHISTQPNSICPIFFKSTKIQTKIDSSIVKFGKNLVWKSKNQQLQQLITVKQDLEISKFSQRPKKLGLKNLAKMNTKQIISKERALLCQPHLEMFGHFGAQLSNNDLPPLRSWVQALYQTSDRMWEGNLSTLCGKYVSVCNMVGMKIFYEIQLMSYHTLFQGMHSLHPQHVFLCSQAEKKHTVPISQANELGAPLAFAQ